VPGKKKTRPRQTPATWFASFPLPDPPGWDDDDGWCRFHYAPVAAITDPAQRATAERLASMDLMCAYAHDIRARVAPLPVPARHLPALIRKHAPVCCWITDNQTYAIVRAAITTAGAA
jgi:hypothetical protein